MQGQSHLWLFQVNRFSLMQRLVRIRFTAKKQHLHSSRLSNLWKLIYSGFRRSRVLIFKLKKKASEFSHSTCEPCWSTTNWNVASTWFHVENGVRWFQRLIGSSLVFASKNIRSSLTSARSISIDLCNQFLIVDTDSFLPVLLVQDGIPCRPLIEHAAPRTLARSDLCASSAKFRCIAIDIASFDQCNGGSDFRFNSQQVIFVIPARFDFTSGEIVDVKDWIISGQR